MVEKPSLCVIGMLLAVRASAAGPVELLAAPATIHSPIEWSVGYFRASRGGESPLARLRIDLDDDGTDELLIGWPAERSRNGIPFLVFKRSGVGYRNLGELVIREDLSGFKVLPRSEDGGMRLIQYWSHGGCQGTIAVLTHDGTRFSVVDSETVCTGDSGTEQGNRRLREVFGN